MKRIWFVRRATFKSSTDHDVMGSTPARVNPLEPSGAPTRFCVGAVQVADEHAARIDLKNRLVDDVVVGAQVSLSFAVAA